ncbi:hypothetical protein JCM10296v2_000731 [Rhodotorula toruloides]
MRGYQQDRFCVSSNGQLRAIFPSPPKEEALLSMMDPEAAKLARHYLYLNPPWVIAPPRLSFDPALDVRKLGKPKTKRDKQERELCRAWRKVEGEARLQRLQEEVADLAKRRREEELQEIVGLAKEIGEVRPGLSLAGWLYRLGSKTVSCFEVEA